MYIIKNAIANLGRNKGRNMILCGMMFLILFSSIAAIMINDAAGEQIKSYKEQFSASVILYRDNEKLKSFADYREPSWKDLQKYATSKLLKNTEFIGSVPASILHAEALDENSTDVSGFDNEHIPGVQKRKPSTNMLIGTNNRMINGEFKSGIRKLNQGRIFEKKDEIIVSGQLAALNNWKLNDTVSLSFPNPGEEAAIVNMKIVGIYEDGVRPYENEDVKLALTNRGNEIMTSMETLTALQSPMVSITANYRIKDPAKIEQLESEFHDMGLPSYFALKTDEAGYQKLIAPLQSLQDMARLFLICVLIIGGGILIVISTLAIRERIYEIGVLRAMGMKKHALASGLLCEILMMTGICLLLAFAGAKASSGVIANQMFHKQTQTTVKQENTNGTALSAIGGFDDASGIEVASLQVEITATVISEIVIAAVLFAVISSAGGIYYAMRYEPRKILSERS